MGKLRDQMDREMTIKFTGLDLRLCPVCGGIMLRRVAFGVDFAYGLPP